MMRASRSVTLFYTILTLTLVLTWLVPASHAGDLVLSNNSGTTSTTWFIDGEPTLIMNGFDLTPLNLTLPVALDAVSINVAEAVPGSTTQIVIYTDGNGGSPQDATLVYQQTVDITQTGNVRIQLAETVVIDEPVIWVGFYLPIGFRFFADESGSSVLTYWAWSPGTTFDLSNLGSAVIFGPSDGTAPVSIDMGGIARITAEIVTQTQDTVLFSGVGETSEGITLGRQIPGGDAPLNVLDNYPFCGEALFFDPDDITISARSAFAMFCRADLGTFSPGAIRNADELPADVPSYERRGFFYEVFAGGDFKADPQDSERLRVPVTHCLRPLEQSELDSAVVGIAYGAPRIWEILPSQRYGELVCAEVTHQGFISYFVPRTGEEPFLNVDLYVSGFPTFVEGVTGRSDQMLCGTNIRWSYAVRNEGFVASPTTNIRIEMRSTRTGEVTRSRDYELPPIQPGETVNFGQASFSSPETFLNESHQIRVIVDPNNSVPELNETNNIEQLDSIIVRNSTFCD